MSEEITLENEAINISAENAYNMKFAYHEVLFTRDETELRIMLAELHKEAE